MAEIIYKNDKFDTFFRNNLVTLQSVLTYIQMMKKIVTLLSLLLLVAINADAIRLEKIKFGDMNQWVKRTIQDSKIIGGQTKTIYEIGPNASIEGAKPYIPQGGSPWETSSVYAKVMGVVKVSGSVEPELRSGSDRCAKMTTKFEHVKALGMINMDVLVSGSIFLGHIVEPISSTKKPYSHMEMGMPYTKRPDYLVFDYKVTVPTNGQLIYSSGFGSQKKLAGQDYAEVYVLLIKRWETPDGKLHAKRVGTGRERFGKTIGTWQNAHQMPIHYGNITGQPFYKSYMGLLTGEAAPYAKNSKGKLVICPEEGWADANEQPTHVMIMASSGCGKPFTGMVGMTFWIDNVAFGFNQ